MKIRTAHVIINPKAGKKRGESLSELDEALKTAGVQVTRCKVEKAGDAKGEAKGAAKRGVDAVIVCGGDGTVQEAAAGLFGTETPLLIVPLGSANVMANEVGIAKDLEKVFASLVQNEFDVQVVDAAKTDKGLFLVRASLGFQADMVKDTHRETKNRFGVLAYFLAALHTLKHMVRAEYRVKVDGVEHRSRGLTCIVTNAGNLGFSKVSLDKNVDVGDGLLDVLVAKRGGMAMVKHLAAMLIQRERPDDWRLVSHWQGRKIEVTSVPKQHLEVDGEVYERSPLNAEVLPGAVRLLVPLKDAA